MRITALDTIHDRFRKIMPLLSEENMVIDGRQH